MIFTTPIEFGAKVWQLPRIKLQEHLTVGQQKVQAQRCHELYLTTPIKNIRPSDRFVEDGSYLRVKNITFGYTVPARIIRKAKMSSARIYVSGTNLFTFTDYSGFDPEVSVNGIDLNTYPVTKTYSLGVNISF